MENIIGKKIYVTNSASRHYCQVGAIVDVFSGNHAVNAKFGGVDDLSDLAYLYNHEFVLVPSRGDRVRLKSKPGIVGTVAEVSDSAVRVAWDRYQDFEGVLTWGLSVSDLEPAVEPKLASGDRVRLTYAKGPTGINGATGTVVEAAAFAGNTGGTIKVRWDNAEHVKPTLRGALSMEAPSSLTKVVEEPKVETPAAVSTGSISGGMGTGGARSATFAGEGSTITLSGAPTENSFWRAAAKALQLVAAKRTYFTTDDIWAKLKASTPEDFNLDPRAMGALMVQAEKMGIVLPTKRSKPSKRTECHRRPIRIWKVTPAGKTNALALNQIQP